MKMGNISLWLALTPWILVLCARVGVLGFGWGSFFGFLVGILIIVAPPAAVVSGIVGLVKDESKKCAMAGLIISGLTCLFWLFFVLFR